MFYRNSEFNSDVSKWDTRSVEKAGMDSGMSLSYFIFCRIIIIYIYVFHQKCLYSSNRIDLSLTLFFYILLKYLFQCFKKLGSSTVMYRSGIHPKSTTWKRVRTCLRCPFFCRVHTENTNLFVVTCTIFFCLLYSVL